MAKPSKRKNLFVDPKVQSALAIRLTLHWILFAAFVSVISISVKWFANPFQSIGGLFSGFLSEQWPVLLTMGLLLPAFIYDSLKLSNRFAGPIIRFRKTMLTITETGTPRHLKFRKGDFWHDLANDFNDMLDTFQSNKDGSRKEPEATDKNDHVEIG
jgi:hypothetical protein